MFKNYFKTAWRKMSRQKILSGINIGGLTAGLTSVLLIGLYIRSELTFDNFHAHGSSIYRVGFKSWEQGVLSGDDPEFTAPFSADAKASITGIASYCRLDENNESWFSYGDRYFKSSAVTYADSSFFQFFSFRLLSGDAATALLQPNSIVLSKSMAEKLFGKDEAIGKTITADSKSAFIVTGIAENAPSNSTIQYEALIPMSSLYHDSTVFMGWNGGWRYQHFLQLDAGADPGLLANSFRSMMWANYNEKYAGSGRVDAYLQPLPELHLYHSPGSGNLRKNLYIFGSISLLILFISCINYINLSVAKAAGRFKEMGVRKVLGASRIQLVKQVLGETLLVTFISLALAAVAAMLLIPAYSDITGKAIAFDRTDIAVCAATMVVLSVLISLAAGGYLSYYLSSCNPVRVMKDQSPSFGPKLRGKPLIILQFTISAALISTVLIIQMQLSYIKNKPVGYDRHQVLVLPLVGNTIQDKGPALKQSIAGTAGVRSVSLLSQIPYDDITQNGFLPEGSKEHRLFHQLDADGDFLQTFGTRLVAGRFFQRQQASGSDECVINETLARQLDWKQPINKIIHRNRDYRVVGVVSDFNFASLHDEIGPLVITNKPWRNRYDYIAVKYSTENPALLIGQLKQHWKQYASGAPFDYWFLDEAFNNIYKGEQRFRQLFFCFSIISIILSLAGVFGLVLLTLQNKKKEIGIRKVLGAGIPGIIQMTAKRFAVPVLLACIVAVPVTWYYVNYWLQNFAYRLPLQWWMFVLPGVMVWLFAFFVISIQGGAAAMANPVKSLKTE